MKSILSIQSAVTFGAVGNTMASLVMAVSGHHLCRVDTIQLAAHPGHGFRAGGSIDDSAFTDLLGGLQKLGRTMPVAALMTGYIGSPGQIEPLAGFISDFSSRNTKIPVIIDPAIGDHGRLYVENTIAEGIARHLVPLAAVITPNQFELGWLTDHEIDNRDQAISAARQLMEKFPRLQAVLLTGLMEDDKISDSLITRDSDTFYEKQGLGRGFPGGGDLFSAIFTASLVNGKGMAESAETASHLCHAILEESRKKGSGEILLSAVRAHLS